MAEKPSLQDRIADAIELADQTFGYSAEMVQMIDRVATYELRIGVEVLTFTDNDDASAAHQYQAHVARARAHHRAEAVLAAIRPTPDARTSRLQVAVIELRAAAAPTKSEVFTCCGSHATQMADDIEALMGEAANG